MSISSKFKKGLYTSLIVAAGLLEAQEVKGQQILIRPAPKNINLFISQDDTEQAKIYNNAKTYEERNSITEAKIAEDWTNTGPFANCNESVLQLLANSHNWKKDTYYGDNLIYNGYDGLDRKLIDENNGTTVDMGKLGLPLHTVSSYDPITLKEGHAQNFLVLGDTLTYENINIIDPRNDQTHIQPGDGRSPLPKNIEHIQLYYNYTYKDDKGKENFWSIKVLEYKSENGKVTETYNINNDTKIQIFFDNKPLNQLVHLQMSRNEIPTATKHQQKLENKIKIYPNPALNYVNIETTINEPTTINMEIYDITGKLVEEYHSNEYGNFKEQIDISKLAKGVYLFNIETETNNGYKHQETKKIVKQ